MYTRAYPPIGTVLPKGYGGVALRETQKERMEEPIAEEEMTAEPLAQERMTEDAASNEPAQTWMEEMQEGKGNHIELPPLQKEMPTEFPTADLLLLALAVLLLRGEQQDNELLMVLLLLLLFD